jgi:hypothetical protein
MQLAGRRIPYGLTHFSFLAAGKGKGMPMIAKETKCVDKCSTKCDPKETEVCKDVETPFTVSHSKAQGIMHYIRGLPSMV